MGSYCPVAYEETIRYCRFRERLSAATATEITPGGVDIAWPQDHGPWPFLKARDARLLAAKAVPTLSYPFVLH